MGRDYRVYGARKLWKAARRAGHNTGRDQVARLMRADDIAGAVRTKRVRTTRRDDTAARHPDLGNRDFSATGPNQLWVTDLTFLPKGRRDRLRVLHHGRLLPDDRRVTSRLTDVHRDAGEGRQGGAPAPVLRPARDRTGRR